MKKFRVAITTGDQDGIGPEITEKTLRKINIPNQVQLIVISSPLTKIRFPSHFKVRRAELDPQSWDFHSDIIRIQSDLSPAAWVEKIAQFQLNGDVDSLVTAPLSKGLIRDSGFNDVGHTDILKRVSKQKNAFMSFWGHHFNVALVTGHLPVQNIERTLTPQLIEQCLIATDRARKYLPPRQRDLPIGLLGLNPHASDQGLIGDFEKRVLTPCLQKLQPELNLRGPLIPDVAFQKQNWEKYSFYVALYHDQGLIPFKMSHGFRGAHLTLGLPIKRSSVDHGTAKDIFGRNSADESSMVDALKWGIRIARG